MSFEFRINASSQADILAHLEQCDESFFGGLKREVNIDEYTQKLLTNAIRLEVWEAGALIGLLAMYVNAGTSAYITNVSIATEFKGRKIASLLMDHSISYAREKKIKTIRLEVKINNIPAITLYEKYNFITCEVNEMSQFMELSV